MTGVQTCALPISEVAAQYAAKGFTSSSLILSKSDRDAAPCNGTWRDTPGGTGYVPATS